jgi:alpha-beta hydrolase superfamily lysophospholipase
MPYAFQPVRSHRGDCSVAPMRPSVWMAVVLAGLMVAPTAAASVRTGPEGTRFYTPPHALVTGPHGSVVWARRLTGPAVLGGAAINELLLYRAVGVRGGAVAVSGTLTTPAGRPPARGWPVISWGHATVGLADRCAPTRSDVLEGYERPLLRRWLRAGFAVVRTDYEGLGTAGVNPDLVGLSEAHAMLDMVLAAHAFDPQLRLRDVALTGHSVGGHAALWATARARSYAPALRIRATVAFAPANHLGEQATALHALTTPDGDLGAVTAVIVTGAQAGSPTLDVDTLLSPRGAELFPKALTSCLPALAAGPFDGVAPADLFRPDADLAQLVARLSANDPQALSFHTPVRIEQGADDAVVLPALTDQLAAGYAQRHLPASYVRYPGVDHFGLVTAAARDATDYLARRLG